jgi:hypothetical protein
MNDNDPNTALPAPMGAITLPIQLTKLLNAPSGCAPTTFNGRIELRFRARVCARQTAHSAQ